MQPARFLSSVFLLSVVACAQTDPPVVPGLLRGMEPDMAELDMRETPVVRAVRQARDSVVSIFITRDRETLDRGIDGQGSGVIIDPTGLVITNWHVIAPVTTSRGGVVVRLRNGKQYGADVLSRSPENDLALLQLRTDERVKAILAGDSDSLMVGETVIAIGNPQGSQNSVTVGVLSNQNRSITVRAPDGRRRTYAGLLQTDAAINQGNSGGALLDITGKLIGINNAMAVGVENIGYAIPVNTVAKVFEEVLVSSENLSSVWFGMRVEDADGVPTVAAVTPAGPAARAGVRRGDRIVRAGTRDVASALDYARASFGAKIGSSFPLRVQRGGRAVSLQVEPMTRIDWELLQRTGMQVETVTAEEDRALLEAASLELYSGTRRRQIPLLPAVLRIKEVQPDSPAAKLALRKGDIVIAAEVRTVWGRWTYKTLRTPQEFADIARDRAGRTLQVVLMRDGEGLEGRLPINRL